MKIKPYLKIFRSREIPTLVIFEFEHGRLSVITGACRQTEPKWFSREDKPADILARGRDMGARTALILIAGEFNELDISLRPGMDEEEIAAAIIRETGKIAGQTVGDERPSWIKPDAIGCEHGLLAQTFTAETVTGWATACKQARLRFDGVTGIYPLLPLAVARGKTGAWLLMQQYGGTAGFNERGKLLFRQLPFGLPGPKLTEDVWITRCRQRLEQMSGRQIHVLDTLPETARAMDILKRELPCEIMLHPFENAGRTLAEQALRLCRLRKIGMAVPPPRKRDPRETGTMICIIMIVSTLVVLSFQHVHLRSSRTTLQQSLERGTSNQQMLDAHNKGIASLMENVERYRFQYNALTERRPVASDFLAVVGILSRQNLQFTRLERLRQGKTGISISGESLMQEELTMFLEQLSDALREHGLHLVPEQLNNDHDSGVVKFKLLLTPTRR